MTSYDDVISDGRSKSPCGKSARKTADSLSTTNKLKLILYRYSHSVVYRRVKEDATMCRAVRFPTADGVESDVKVLLHASR